MAVSVVACFAKIFFLFPTSSDGICLCSHALHNAQDAWEIMQIHLALCLPGSKGPNEFFSASDIPKRPRTQGVWQACPHTERGKSLSSSFPTQYDSKQIGHASGKRCWMRHIKLCMIVGLTYISWPGTPRYVMVSTNIPTGTALSFFLLVL